MAPELAAIIQTSEEREAERLRHRLPRADCAERSLDADLHRSGARLALVRHRAVQTWLRYHGDGSRSRATRACCPNWWVSSMAAAGCITSRLAACSLCSAFRPIQALWDSPASATSSLPMGSCRGGLRCQDVVSLFGRHPVFGRSDQAPCCSSSAELLTG